MYISNQNFNRWKFEKIKKFENFLRQFFRPQNLGLPVEFTKQSKMAAGRERAIKERSLVCLLSALQGHKTTIELRNEDYVEGTVSHVDGFMNVTLSDAKFFKNKSEQAELFPKIFLLGEKIRYVHIPDEIDMRQAIENELRSIEESRKVKNERRKMRGRRTKM